MPAPGKTLHMRTRPRTRALAMIAIFRLPCLGWFLSKRVFNVFMQLSVRL
jgi:hypothetical protein